MLSWPEYSRFAVSLFAILTPFAAVPTFLSLTEDLPSLERSRIATAAAGTAALVLVVAALLGNVMLTLLGTSLGSLRVGGGLVLLMVAFSMLNPASASPSTPSRRSSCGIVPLGLPILAGPGAISAVIVEMGHGAGAMHATIVVLCVLSICAVAWTILRLAEPLGKRVGQEGIHMMTRVFGFLLAAVAVEITTTGLRSLFPVLR
jgi:multiple antibiotic resistance protein